MKEQIHISTRMVRTETNIYGQRTTNTHTHTELTRKSLRNNESVAIKLKKHANETDAF